jgi:glutamate--cysteine ligase
MIKQNKSSTLNPSWLNRLESFPHSEFSSVVKGIRKGIEKESLRVNSDARLASTPHPPTLGSPLTHQWVITDFAEAQLEFITPAGTNTQTTLDIMADLHKHTYQQLDEELLWPASMPCIIDLEDDIELAHYGDSHLGKMKTLYRQGLKSRYGSMMEVIAGVHYNFSMPDKFWPVWQKLKGDRQPLQEFISECYLGLIRNFFRFNWLITYLFGASPVVDSTFWANSSSTLSLETLGTRSYCLPHATSLRMSNFGYNTREQDHLDISYNTLQEFVNGLRKATTESNPVFEKIGVKRQGKYQQLNTNTLQLENELYAPIRPKRVAKTDEKLSDALQNRGVEYVEVRSLDINPYTETGIDREQVYFLDVFLTYCLLQDSPHLSIEQHCTAKKNQNRVATSGRDLSLELLDDTTPKSIKTWGEELFEDLTDIALLLDRAEQGEKFQAALKRQYQLLTNPELTLSARMLRDMREQNLEFNELALSLAKRHRDTLLKTDYSQIKPDDFAAEVKASLQKQREIEMPGTLSSS